MFKNEYTLSVDLKKKMTSVMPTFIQYDNAVLIFKIFDDGKKFKLDGFTKAEVSHRKPDGTVEIGEAVIEGTGGNQWIKYTYYGTEMNQLGYVDTSLSLHSADKKVSIQPFKVFIAEDLAEQYASPANPQVGALQQLIATVEKLKVDTELAKNEAIKQAGHAKTQGDYAKTQGDYSKTQGTYAKDQGDYAKLEGGKVAGTIANIDAAIAKSDASALNADEKATLANTQADYAKSQGDAAGLASSNLTQLKEDVIEATTSANATKDATETVRLATEAERLATALVRTATEKERLDTEVVRLATITVKDATETERLATEQVRLATIIEKEKTAQVIVDAVEATTEARLLVDEWEFAGNHNIGTQYKKNNVVSFNGSSYIALKSNIGIVPVGNTDDLTWRLVSRKGEDGTGIVVLHKDTFVATANQKLFTLSNSYDQLQNRIHLIIGGVPQYSPESFFESSSNTFTLNVGVPVGTEITAIYFGNAPAIVNDLQLQITGLNDIIQHIGLEAIRAAGDYAQTQGDYAKTAANEINTASANANAAATNANAKATIAQTSATNADAKAQLANDKATLADGKATLANTAATTANTKIGEMNALLPLVSGLENKGEYNNLTAYKKNNTVRYNGSSYQALVDSTGKLPTDVLSWSLTAQRGIDGSGSVVSVNGAHPDVGGNVEIIIPKHVNEDVLDGLTEDAGQLQYKGMDVGSVVSVNGQVGEVTGLATEIQLTQEALVAETNANAYTDEQVKDINVFVKKDEFIATEGQTLFVLSDSYNLNQNRLSVDVGSVPQYYPANFNETSTTSFTLSGGVPAGVLVVATYYSARSPISTDIEGVVDGYTGRIITLETDNVTNTTKIANHETRIGNFDAHLNDKANPHGTTKAIIGLGNVDNVQQATKAEFNSHIANIALHTTAIQQANWNAKETLVGAQSKADTAYAHATRYTDDRLFLHKEEITNHTGHTDNPHHVTATQTGAYTTEETDNRIGVVADAFDSHEIVIASPTTLGHIKVGENLTVTSDGTLNASASTVLDATLTTKGIVQLNNTVNSASTTLAATANSVKLVNDKILPASTVTAGVVQLNTSVTSTSTTQAATASATKTAYDLASTANNTANNASNNASHAMARTAYSQIYLGDQSRATGSNAIALGAYCVVSAKNAISIGHSVDNSSPNRALLGAPNGGGVWDSTDYWVIQGTLSVQGTKQFEMPHPHPDKKHTHMLRHSSVESPTAGETLYRYTIEALVAGETVEIQLPDYFKYLNKDVDVYVSPHMHFGRAFGVVVEGDVLKVTCETAGEYKALIIGTRNDDNVQNWDIRGVERENGEGWEGQTYGFEVDEFNEYIELEEVE